MEKTNKPNIKLDYTKLLKQDIIDDFQIFMENATHQKKEYTLTGIINEFIDYMEEDIKDNFLTEEIETVKLYIKNVCFDNKDFLLKKYGKYKEEG